MVLVGIHVRSDNLLRIERVHKASKFMIDTGAGVIDADYRGVIFVLLFNYSDQDFQGIFFEHFFPIDAQPHLVEEGDRIAQLIIERIITPDVLEVEVSLLLCHAPES